MEEGAEAAEELCVDHLARSLPLEVGVVQSVVLVQPEEGNADKKRKKRYTCNQNMSQLGLLRSLSNLGPYHPHVGHSVVEIIRVARCQSALFIFRVKLY